MTRLRAARSPGRRLRTASAILLAILATACGGRGRSNPFYQGGQFSGIILRVESRNISVAEIYIYTQGERTLLGVVEPGAVEFFEFGWNMTRALDVEIDIVLEGRYRLPPLVSVRAGRAELYIARSIRNSFLTNR